MQLRRTHSLNNLVVFRSTRPCTVVVIRRIAESHSTMALDASETIALLKRDKRPEVGCTLRCHGTSGARYTKLSSLDRDRLNHKTLSSVRFLFNEKAQQQLRTLNP